MDMPTALKTPSQPVCWNDELVGKYDVPGPRYTSYPTAPQFNADFGAGEYESWLRERPATIGPLSLYVHIPFCRDICYYCACNKIVTRDATAGERYLLALEKEIALLSRHFDRRRHVTQLHWGGGTPTFLGNAELTRLLHSIASHFTLVDSPDREYSIEIDPRTVDGGTIALLKGIGFNRVSLGIQDFDPAVQAAINRVQSVEMVSRLVKTVREHRFKSLGFDLIYGLPGQSLASMSRTVDAVIDLAPDRISCYSYAHIPDIIKTQRTLDRAGPVPADVKLAILHMLIERLGDAGYLYIGMDHFVRQGDDLARALTEGTLQRNFQGYSTLKAPELLGLGVSAITSSGALYAQNVKTLDEYYACLESGGLPIQRGVLLSAEDRLRRDVIMRLACRMEVGFAEIEELYELDFVRHFADEMETLEELERDGLVEIDNAGIRVTPTGRLLVRNVCMVFDAYLRHRPTRHSSTI